jgi:hypothetical protein
MSSRKHAVIGIVGLALLGASPAGAQYAIVRWVAAGGGGTSAGSAFALTGSAGQPIATGSAGGSYALSTGFWLGSPGVVSVGDDGPPKSGAPRVFSLHPAAPNPFHKSTTLEFDLPRESHARLVMYDAAGRAVATLADGVLPAGRHHRAWNGSGANGRRLGAGVYFVRLETGERLARRKVILLP